MLQPYIVTATALSDIQVKKKAFKIYPKIENVRLTEH